MEDSLILNKTLINSDQTARTKISRNIISPERAVNNPVIDNLLTEGGENFLHYLHRVGLANEQNLLVLSSRRHYYYDYNDLKGLTILINLKKLNLIRHLDSFLHTVSK